MAARIIRFPVLAKPGDREPSASDLFRRARELNRPERLARRRRAPVLPFPTPGSVPPLVQLFDEALALWRQERAERERGV